MVIIQQCLLNVCTKIFSNSTLFFVLFSYVSPMYDKKRTSMSVDLFKVQPFP